MLFFALVFVAVVVENTEVETVVIGKQNHKVNNKIENKIAITIIIIIINHVAAIKNK